MRRRNGGEGFTAVFFGAETAVRYCAGEPGPRTSSAPGSPIVRVAGMARQRVPRSRTPSPSRSACGRCEAQTSGVSDRLTHSARRRFEPVRTGAWRNQISRRLRDQPTPLAVLHRQYGTAGAFEQSRSAPSTVWKWHTDHLFLIIKKLLQEYFVTR